MAVAFDAFEKTSAQFRPNMENMMEWMGQTSIVEQANRDYARAISDLSDLYQSLGLRMLVLKGYGCALNYPIPSHRPCGDIDIFLRDENGNHSDSLVKRFEQMLESRFGIQTSYHNTHHSRFLFEGLCVADYQ